MESFVRTPDALKDNKPNSWTIWKEEFLVFMNLLGYMERPQSFKANLFKNLIGSVGLETINKLSFEREEDKQNLDKLIKKLDNYYHPQKTEVQKRHAFFKNTRKDNETIENYIQRLKQQAKDCNFGTMTDSLIRDVIILHTNDRILKNKYLQEEDLNCDKIVTICKNHKIEHFKEENKQAINKNKQNSKQTESGDQKHTQINCKRCCTNHPIRRCPAWNYKCTKCNLFHHFEQCCKNSQKNTSNLNMNNLDINKDKQHKLFYNFD